MSENTTSSTASAEASDQPTTISEQVDVLDHLMKPEVQESLTVLVENLPKLAEMTTLLTKTYDIAQQVMTDKVLIDDVTSGVKDIVKPVQDKVKVVAAAAMEANERSQSEGTTIGLFGLLKMLKDPQVQNILRFSQAFLTVMAEKNNEQ